MTTDIPLAWASIGTMKRIVDPDSPQSTAFSGTEMQLTPLTRKLSFAILMSVPYDPTASTVALTSSLKDGFSIFDVPSDIDAAITARCV